MGTIRSAFREGSMNILAINMFLYFCHIQFRNVPHLFKANWSVFCVLHQLLTLFRRWLRFDDCTFVVERKQLSLDLSKSLTCIESGS